MAQAQLSQELSQRRQFDRQTAQIRAGEEIPASEPEEDDSPEDEESSQLPQVIQTDADQQAAGRELSLQQRAAVRQQSEADSELEETGEQSGNDRKQSGSKASDAVDTARKLGQLFKNAKGLAVATGWAIVIAWLVNNYQLFWGNIMHGAIFPASPLSTKEFWLTMFANAILFGLLIFSWIFLMILMNPCYLIDVLDKPLINQIKPYLIDNCPSALNILEKLGI